MKRRILIFVFFFAPVNGFALFFRISRKIQLFRGGVTGWCRTFFGSGVAKHHVFPRLVLPACTHQQNATRNLLFLLYAELYTIANPRYGRPKHVRKAPFFMKKALFLTAISSKGRLVLQPFHALFSSSARVVPITVYGIVYYLTY